MQEPPREATAISNNMSNSNSNSNSNLQDSEFTADSSENESESSGRWFGGLGSDILSIAHCLTDNVSPVVSGVATFVHRTAVAVANEISQLERDGELETAAAIEERPSKKNSRGTKGSGTAIILSPSSFDSTSTSNKSESLILPWEICQESQTNLSTQKENDEITVYFTDTDLMNKIFVLSRQESTFLEPFSEDSPEGNNKSFPQNINNMSLSSYSSTFVIDDSRVKLIHRLLDIDDNLASMHTELTRGENNSWDTFFWKNYFFHCEGTRANELRWRKQNCSEKKPCTSTESVGKNSSPLEKGNVEMKSALNHVDRFTLDGSNRDDESLISLDSDTERQHDDNSSYVIQSAPNSVDTFTTTTSIDDDVVLVDTYETVGRNYTNVKK
mmetsp:Transcript_24757/g.26627  ORF Transcript_24757/g.26627 Transcript_24757/m.26627 type:complete len:386 (-) Transcript_24757:542-1699(-)